SMVIEGCLNVGSIPYFTVANSFIICLVEFLIAIAAVVMPTATRLQTQGKQEELREIFLKWSKIALSITMVAGLFLIVLGPRFIAWWVDPTFEQPAGQVLQILMLSYLIFLPVRGVALPILMGLGKAGLPTIGFLVAGVLNLGLSILLVRPFSWSLPRSAAAAGSAGAAATTCGRPGCVTRHARTSRSFRRWSRASASTLIPTASAATTCAVTRTGCIGFWWLGGAPSSAMR